MRRLVMAALVAGAAVLAPATVSAAAPLNPNEVCTDGNCYLVTTTVTGYHLTYDANGNIIGITPIEGGAPSGAGVPIGRIMWQPTRLGQQVPKTYYTTLSWYPFNTSLVDVSSLPPPIDRRDGVLKRQPLLSLDRPSWLGTFYEHGVINPAQELAAQGKPLAPNQIEYLRRRIAETGGWVPGTLYVTLILAPAPDGRWRVSRWLYNFEARWQEALNLPPPQCPPGSPGTWPNCNEASLDDECSGGLAWNETTQTCEPPPPPPPPSCPPDYEWNPATNACEPRPPGCPECGDIDPGGRVRLIR